jgi:hypothetical protein
MTNADSPQAALARVAARFPDSALLIRRLFLTDEVFRNVCEDYVLAQDILLRFENRPDARQRPEIADYVSVIADLESEIAALLRPTTGSAMENNT